MVEKQKSSRKGILEEKDWLVHLVNEALLTDKAEQAIAAIKEKHPEATRLSREALADFMAIILPMIASPYLGAFNGLKQVVVQHAEETASEHEIYMKQVTDLATKVDALASEQKKLFTDHGRHLLEILLPHGVLRKRYQEDHPNEKNRIVGFVANMFFRSSTTIRCFVQASTTTIRLGHVLLKNGKHLQDCLLYTNSAAVPMTILKEDSPFRVYAFCGPSYDPMCGGWLFGEDDNETPAELRRLFTRQHGKLTHAFLTPLAITLDGSMYYMRKEAAKMAGILIELAEQTVVLAPANRIYERPDQFPPTSAYYLAKPEGVRLPNCKTDLIVDGSPPNGTLKDHADSLAKVGFCVHWYDGETRQWAKALINHGT